MALRAIALTIALIGGALGGFAKADPPQESLSPHPSEQPNSSLPPYPRSALAAGIGGTVMVGVHILPDGSVSKVSLQKSSGHKSLDDAALTAIMEWKFNPISPDQPKEERFALVPLRFVPRKPDADGYILDTAYIRYPLLSRLLNEHGVVILKIRLSPKNRIEHQEIFFSSGIPRLDKAALKSDKNMKFSRTTTSWPPKSEWRYVKAIFADEVGISLLPSEPEGL